MKHHLRSAQGWHVFSKDLSFTCTPTRSSAIGMSHTCLCLPSLPGYTGYNVWYVNAPTNSRPSWDSTAYGAVLCKLSDWAGWVTSSLAKDDIWWTHRETRPLCSSYTHGYTASNLPGKWARPNCLRPIPRWRPSIPRPRRLPIREEIGGRGLNGSGDPRHQDRDHIPANCCCNFLLPFNRATFLEPIQNLWRGEIGDHKKK